MKKQIKYIILHHTAVSHETQPAQFYAVNRYHKNKNWGTKENPWYQKKPSKLGYYTGYNYFIGTNGCLTQIREIGEETMAVIGHNLDSIHICLAGDFNHRYPTRKQENTLVKCLTDLKQIYPTAKIKLHREMQKNRTCPGILIDKMYLEDSILDRLDIDDRNKQIQIQKLHKLLDSLRELLHNLMLKLR